MTNAYDARPDASTPMVDQMLALERARGLDRVVDLLRPVASALVADPGRRDLLRGKSVGHALHPALTDVPIGLWTSATVLDLLGGKDARPAARKLLGVGLLAALPTVVTGLAEWAGTGEREQRVGAVHASANALALTLYAASWQARGRDRQASGVALALAGSAAATVGGFLGGHLVAARKVSSRNPAFGS